MNKLIVTVNKLNKRTSVPASFSDKTNIAGTVNKDFTFIAEEVTGGDNAQAEKWYKDRNNYYYWGGGLKIIEDDTDVAINHTGADNTLMESFVITPVVKKKIEQVINAFETGSAEGNYGILVKLKDYKDPATGVLMVQVTYGRSQTTEFGHLKALVSDYVNHAGIYDDTLAPYLPRIGKKPSLATDAVFCDTLKKAGKTDPIMKTCQNNLFETKYYQPANNWFTTNGFKLPLSMLVIYDSYIHSGSIMSFLRNKFATVVPSNGGDEKEWIKNYVNVRENWLANHSNPLLHQTVYRTKCFKAQMQNNNWDLAQSIKANGVTIS